MMTGVIATIFALIALKKKQNKLSTNDEKSGSQTEKKNRGQVNAAFIK